MVDQIAVFVSQGILLTIVALPISVVIHSCLKYYEICVQWRKEYTRRQRLMMKKFNDQLSELAGFE